MEGLMRTIIERHTLIDSKGFAWEAQITVPDGKYGPPHGPDQPTVTIQTPNDPEHWAYGEDGPTFELGYLATLVALGDFERAG